MIDFIGGDKCVYCGGLGFGCVACTLASFKPKVLSRPPAPDAREMKEHVALTKNGVLIHREPEGSKR